MSDDKTHSQTAELLSATGLIDVLIPRGGADLIHSCVQNAKVPTIETGTGNCHVYLHRDADVKKAVAIVANAKTSRPGTSPAWASSSLETSWPAPSRPRPAYPCPPPPWTTGVASTSTSR